LPTCLRRKKSVCVNKKIVESVAECAAAMASQSNVDGAHGIVSYFEILAHMLYMSLAVGDVHAFACVKNAPYTSDADVHKGHHENGTWKTRNCGNFLHTGFYTCGL